MLVQTLGFFTLLVLLFGAFMLFLQSSQKQSKDQDEVLAAAVADKAETEKKIKELQDEMLVLRQDLTLKAQMFDGLRGQYEELEKDYEKLRQKSEKQAAITIENSPAPRQAAEAAGQNQTQSTADSGSPFIKII